MKVAHRRLTIAASIIGGLLTLGVGTLPFVQSAYHSPQMHVALETVAVLITLVAGYLVFGRFRQSGQLGDLALVYALALFSLGNVVFAVVPEIAGGQAEPFSIWARLGAESLGACAFAFAAFGGERQVGIAHRAITELLVVSVATLAAIAAMVAIFANRLPEKAVLNPTFEDGIPIFQSHAIVEWVQVGSMIAFAIAAVGFTRRAERYGDEVMGWFAAASTLSAFARLNFALYPSLYSEWVYSGDMLRLGFFLLLLVGAFEEIKDYWRDETDLAVSEERRRMARELHDGLAQELAFIATQTRAMSAHQEIDPRYKLIAGAAERALDESRRAIATLTRPIDEPLDVALAQTAEEIASRAGLRLEMHMASRPDVTPSTREEVLRVAREALNNAVRHGRARAVTVRLWENNGVRLEIADDGAGFDVGEAGDGHGFGLLSMQERISALGGDLHIESNPGRGTQIEVVLP